MIILPLICLTGIENRPPFHVASCISLKTEEDAWNFTHKRPLFHVASCVSFKTEEDAWSGPQKGAPEGAPDEHSLFLMSLVGVVSVKPAVSDHVAFAA